VHLARPDDRSVRRLWLSEPWRDVHTHRLDHVATLPKRSILQSALALSISRKQICMSLYGAIREVKTLRRNLELARGELAKK
jgi:hypothetical protein